MSSLGTRLDEHQVVFLGLILALLRSDLALFVQIGLVAHQDDDDVVPSLSPDIIDPFLGVLEGFRVYSGQPLETTRENG